MASADLFSLSWERKVVSLLFAVVLLLNYRAVAEDDLGLDDGEYVHDPAYEHSIPEEARRLIAEEPHLSHGDLVQNDTFLPRRDLLAGRRGSGWWSTRGNKFVDQQGRIVYFSGIIWSGFETPEACVHGIWSRSYQSHLDQMVSLGFNALRLPFAGDTLIPSTLPKGIDYGSNPGLQGLNSLQVMDRIIYAAGLRGMKVILDYHRLHLTIKNELGLWYDYYTPESKWINNWVFLARRYQYNPTVIMADLFNEVHNDKSFPAGVPFWARDGFSEYPRNFNYRTACKRAINAIQRVNRNIIVSVGGTWNNYWWGGNVARLFSIPIYGNIRGKIAYSTHEYGPYVFMQEWFKAPTFPNNLPSIFYRFWGSVIYKNVAPVWMGEFGTFLPQTNSLKDIRERRAFYALRNYMRLLRVSWTYAFWGPDSKDTGGILNEDWMSPAVGKLMVLRPIMHPNFGPSVGQKW